MRDAFIDELLELARKDPEIFLIVGDLGYGVIDSFTKELPDQFLNAGVAEQSMLGIAAGMAASGHKVFVYSIANFPTMRTLEQIRNDICYHDLPVTVVAVGAGVAYGTLGYSHHALEDLTVMRALPGIRILSPADPAEARQAAQEARTANGPVYVRLGKNGEPLLHTSRPVSLTEPINLCSGNDVLVLAVGAVAGECVAASQLLKDDGINAAVYSCPTVKPFTFDWTQIHSGTSLIVTVEEHTLDGGLSTIVLEDLNDQAIPAKVLRLGLNIRHMAAVGSGDYLRQLHGLDAQGIYTAIRNRVKPATARAADVE